MPSKVRIPRDPDARRALGLESHSDDVAIDTRIREGAARETGVDARTLSVSVSSGIVSLEGDIDGRLARLRLTSWILRLPGVLGIHDGTRLLDSQAEVLADERRAPAYGGLREVQAPQPESARRRGGPTG